MYHLGIFREKVTLQPVECMSLDLGPVLSLIDGVPYDRLLEATDAHYRGYCVLARPAYRDRRHSERCVADACGLGYARCVWAWFCRRERTH